MKACCAKPFKTWAHVFGAECDAEPHCMPADDRLRFCAKLIESPESSSVPYPFIIGGVACQHPENYRIFLRTVEACKSLNDALLGNPDVDAEVYWTRAVALCDARGAGCQSGGGVGLALISHSRDQRLAASARAGMAIFENGVDGLRTPAVLETILNDAVVADVFGALDLAKVKASWRLRTSARSASRR